MQFPKPLVYFKNSLKTIVILKLGHCLTDITVSSNKAAEVTSRLPSCSQPFASSPVQQCTTQLCCEPDWGTDLPSKQRGPPFLPPTLHLLKPVYFPDLVVSPMNSCAFITPYVSTAAGLPTWCYLCCWVCGWSCLLVLFVCGFVVVGGLFFVCLVVFLRNIIIYDRLPQRNWRRLITGRVGIPLFLEGEKEKFSSC